ncbi:MAG TPA: YbfB/YjiJ family MFS transporter [Streptosporangiaceae bacterium]
MTRYAAPASPKYDDVTDRFLDQGGDRGAARHRGRHRAGRQTATTIAGVAAVALAIGVARFALTPVAPLMLASGALRGIGALARMAMANYLGNLAGTVLCVTIIPRTAQLRALQVGAVTIVLVTAAMAGPTTELSWLLLRAVAGVAGAIVFVCGSSIVIGRLDSRNASAGTARLYRGIGGGIALAALVVMPATGWRFAWLYLAALAAVLAYPACRWIRQPSSGTGTRGTGVPGQLLLDQRRPSAHAMTALCAAFFLEGLGYIVTGTFLPDLSGRALSGGQVWLVAGLAAVPSCALWGKFVSRRGLARVLPVAFAVQAAGIALPAMIGSPGAGLLSAVLFGGTFAAIVAMVFAWARTLPGGPSPRSVGVLACCYGAGQVLGPLLASSGIHIALLLGAAAVAIAIGPLLYLGWRTTQTRFCLVENSDVRASRVYAARNAGVHELAVRAQRERVGGTRRGEHAA